MRLSSEPLNARNRLLLELMARGGMRVSEVLNLTPNDVDGRRLIIRDSKGGRGEEVVFIPPELASRFKDYISERRDRTGAEDLLYNLCGGKTDC